MFQSLTVVGLGNPGKRYEHTRHNLGFRVVEALAVRRGASWTQLSRSYRETGFVLGNSSVALIEPLTYMNLSGGALLEIGHSREIDPGAVLVVCDDLALPLGRVRLRRKGSDGGHNGLRSIIDALGTSEFPRLRLGVGPVPTTVDPADFVLDRFSADERAAVEASIARAVECIEDVIQQGIDRAMNRHNALESEPESD